MAAGAQNLMSLRGRELNQALADQWGPGARGRLREFMDNRPEWARQGEGRGRSYLNYVMKNQDSQGFQNFMRAMTGATPGVGTPDFIPGQGVAQFPAGSFAGDPNDGIPDEGEEEVLEQKMRSAGVDPNMAMSGNTGHNMDPRFGPGRQPPPMPPQAQVPPPAQQPPLIPPRAQQPPMRFGTAPPRPSGSMGGGLPRDFRGMQGGPIASSRYNGGPTGAGAGNTTAGDGRRGGQGAGRDPSRGMRSGSLVRGRY
jgi:hypothetical protein